MIISDSSLYKHPYSVGKSKESDIRIGIVRSEIYIKENDTYSYRVDVQTRGRRYTLVCRQMEKFGDTYNYEEWKARTGGPKAPIPSPPVFARMVGEVVVVAHIDGSGDEGIILGCLRHPSRKTKLTATKLSYASEYNGLETTIDNDGAWKIKFQGTPKNAGMISKLPYGSPIPPALYDPTSSGSFLTFDKTGSFTLSDANKSLPQTIKIDKPNGKISIFSGNVSIVIEKNSKKISVVNSDTEVKSEKSFKLTTQATEINSSKTFKLKSPKIAIGSGGTELLDHICKFMDEVSKLAQALSQETHTGNFGYPTSPPLNAAAYTAVKSAVDGFKSKVSAIKGSL